MANIMFVREYLDYSIKKYDVIYESGRAYTYYHRKLPKTAQDFIASAKHRVLQHDSIFNRDEIIYTKGLPV